MSSALRNSFTGSETEQEVASGSSACMLWCFLHVSNVSSIHLRKDGLLDLRSHLLLDLRSLGSFGDACAACVLVVVSEFAAKHVIQLHVSF